MNETICNWDYKIEMEGIKNNFYIIPDIKIEIPKFLNKYYPLNSLSIESLEKGYFFINHPEGYNDPFESFKGFLLKNEIGGYIDFFRHFGIISFSKEDLNQLMWAHYCNQNGFLLKFKTDYLKTIFHGPYPINYQKSKPILSNIKDIQVKLFFITNVKPYIWNYENEFRFLYESAKELGLPKFDNYETINSKIPISNRFKPYDNEKIEELIIGYKFFIEEEILINNNIMMLKTNHPLKQRLLEFIIKNKVSAYIIDADNESQYFNLKKNKILIKRLSRIFSKVCKKEYEIVIVDI
jgi:hypothetical protein